MKPIHIIQQDFVRLKGYIQSTQYNENKQNFETRNLFGKILSAVIIPKAELDKKIAIMNSTVYIEFTKKSIHKKFQIVYPNNVSVKEQKISIFSPIAAAVFGRSEGDIIECILPGGKTEIKIVKIENQLKKTSI